MRYLAEHRDVGDGREWETPCRNLRDVASFGQLCKPVQWSATRRGLRGHAREGDAGQDPGLSTLEGPIYYFLAFVLSRSRKLSDSNKKEESEDQSTRLQTKYIQSAVPTTTRQEALVVQRPRTPNNKLSMWVMNVHQMRSARWWSRCPSVGKKDLNIKQRTRIV